MLFKRSLFFVVVMSLMLCGVLFGGAAGGYAVGEWLLGGAVMSARPYYLTSWITWVEVILLSVGSVIGFAGVVALLVYPLYFFCPKARVPFSWQRKDTRWEKKLLGWYGRQLQILADSLSVPD
jgi:hypothetical protein